MRRKRPKKSRRPFPGRVALMMSHTHKCECACHATSIFCGFCVSAVTG